MPITLYSFDELPEETQEKAINNLSDINVDHDWWEFIFEDAEEIGLSITEFDLGNNKIIKGTLNVTVIECYKRILKNHGKYCDTYNTARKYLKEYGEAFYKWQQEEYDKEPINPERGEYDWPPQDWLYEFRDSPEEQEITDDFKKELLEEYFAMLNKEYDYKTSEKAIKETIKLNEYLFDENGTLA